MTVKLVLAAAALALGAPAFAADLGPAPAEPAASAAYSWSGPYVGLHLGYGWGDVDVAVLSGGLPAPLVSGDYDIDGFLGGIQLGYNIQFDSFVLGLETDLSWSGMDGEFDLLAGTAHPAHASSVDWFGTVRLRAGLAVDEALFYVTGGLAYGGVDHVFARTVTGIPFAESSDAEFGWTLGAGLEYAFSPNWTLKAEYLYVDLGGQNLSGIFDPNFPIFDVDYETRFHTARVGLNYRF